jgi:hypothetical protein
MVTRTELDDLLDQQHPRDEDAFLAAIGVATSLCWEDIPMKAKEEICRGAALLLGLNYPPRLPRI